MHGHISAANRNVCANHAHKEKRSENDDSNAFAHAADRMERAEEESGGAADEHRDEQRASEPAMRAKISIPNSRNELYRREKKKNAARHNVQQRREAEIAEFVV